MATIKFDTNTVVVAGLENADLSPAQDFWLVIIVTAYQSHHNDSGDSATTADGDPDKEYHIHGTAFATGDTSLYFARVPTVGGYNIVLFFRETDMDYVSQAANGYWANWGHTPRPLSFLEPRVLAHEIGHVFSLTHKGAAGTLMQAWDGGDYELNAMQIDIVRSSTHLAVH